MDLEEFMKEFIEFDVCIGNEAIRCPYCGHIRKVNRTRP